MKSNCCDANGNRLMSEEMPISFEEAGICPECGEHCEFLTQKELNEEKLNSNE